MAADAGPAVLFDVDGTLVDTNWFHTLAWFRSFRDHGEQVPMSRIQPLIGMGSAEMLEELLDGGSEELSAGHGEHFNQFLDEIVAFKSADELLREVHRRGAKVVLATSAKPEHIPRLCEVIDADDAIDEVIGTADAERGKPNPDIFQVCVDRLKLDRAKTIVVGDTVWDVKAAADSGLSCVAVLTGGQPRERLTEEGAVAVYEDVADLLAHLDDSPLAKIIGTTT